MTSENPIVMALLTMAERPYPGNESDAMLANRVDQTILANMPSALSDDEQRKLLLAALLIFHPDKWSEDAKRCEQSQKWYNLYAERLNHLKNHPIKPPPIASEDDGPDSDNFLKCVWRSHQAYAWPVRYLIRAGLILASLIPVFLYVVCIGVDLAMRAIDLIISAIIVDSIMSLTTLSMDEYQSKKDDFFREYDERDCFENDFMLCLWLCVWEWRALEILCTAFINGLTQSLSSHSPKLDLCRRLLSVFLCPPLLVVRFGVALFVHGYVWGMALLYGIANALSRMVGFLWQASKPASCSPPSNTEGNRPGYNTPPPEVSMTQGPLSTGIGPTFHPRAASGVLEVNPNKPI